MYGRKVLIVLLKYVNISLVTNINQREAVRTRCKISFSFIHLCTFSRYMAPKQDLRTPTTPLFILHHTTSHNTVTLSTNAPFDSFQNIIDGTSNKAIRISVKLPIKDAPHHKALVVKHFI